MTPTLTPQPATVQDGRHDFDFLFGTWTVHNRRLARRLAGCEDWQTFQATQEAWPVLGGLGNMDRLRADFPDGRPLEGLTMRFFDPLAKAWSIYWVDDRSFQLQPPVMGRFTGNQGTFYGEDRFEGRPIRVRFIWTVVSGIEAHWEQAFSEDGGATWETNWTMRFLREGQGSQPSIGAAV